MFHLFSAPKKISPREFKVDIRERLRGRGLSHRDVEQVESMAMGSLFESGRQRGIDRREADQLIDTLHENRSSHSLSPRQIDIVKDVLSEEF